MLTFEQKLDAFARHLKRRGRRCSCGRYSQKELVALADDFLKLLREDDWLEPLELIAGMRSRWARKAGQTRKETKARAIKASICTKAASKQLQLL